MGARSTGTSPDESAVRPAAAGGALAATLLVASLLAIGLWSAAVALRFPVGPYDEGLLLTNAHLIYAIDLDGRALDGYVARRVCRTPGGGRRRARGHAARRVAAGDRPLVGGGRAPISRRPVRRGSAPHQRATDPAWPRPASRLLHAVPARDVSAHRGDLAAERRLAAGGPSVEHRDPPRGGVARRPPGRTGDRTAGEPAHRRADVLLAGTARPGRLCMDLGPR